MKTNKAAGFTLIELLVVIAIVAVIAGTLLVAVNPQEMIRKGRDAKRMQDVDTLVKAINLGLADGEMTLSSTSNCADCNSLDGKELVDGTGYVKFTIPAGKAGLSKFIPTLPLDPLNTDSFVYSYGSDGTNFEVDAVLESKDNATRMATDGGNSPLIYEVGTALTII